MVTIGDHICIGILIEQAARILLDSAKNVVLTPLVARPEGVKKQDSGNPMQYFWLHFSAPLLLRNGGAGPAVPQRVLPRRLPRPLRARHARRQLQERRQGARRRQAVMREEIDTATQKLGINLDENTHE